MKRVRVRSALVRRGLVHIVVAAGVAGLVAITPAPPPLAAASTAIDGKLTLGTGGPLVGGFAIATSPDGARSFAATTNASGNYSINVTAGTYCVSFASAANKTVVSTYNGAANCLDGATMVDVPASTVVPNINATLHFGSISGVVTKGGFAVPNLAMDAEQIGASGEGVGVTGPIGTYTIAYLPPGTYCVGPIGAAGAIASVGLPACRPGLRRVTVVPDAPTPNVDFVLDSPGPTTGSISGTVTGAGGLPLANRPMTAITFDRLGYGYANTAADGTYTINGLPPGAYCVKAEVVPGASPGAEAYANKESCNDATPVVVASGPVPNIDFALEQGGSIAGLITSPGAVPVTGANVRVQTFGDVTGKSWLAQAQSVAGGLYEVAGLPAGQYCLSVRDIAGNWANEAYADVPTCASGASPVSVVRGATTTINVELAAGGTIQGKVTVPAGQDPTKIRASTKTEDRTVVAEVSVDAAGNYKLQHLPPGNYCVWFQAADTDMVYMSVGGTRPQCNHHLGTIVVANGAVVPVDATMQLGGSVSGWTVTGDGHPVANPVALLSDDESLADDLQIGVTDDRVDGSFRIGAVPPGDWCLTVYSADQGVATISYTSVPACSLGATLIHVESGQAITGLRLRPGAIGYIEGRVTFPTAASVAGARIDVFAVGSTTPANTRLLQGFEGQAVDYSMEVPTGSYCVLVNPGPGSAVATRAYPTAPACGRGSTPVAVTVAELTTGIDITLVPSVYIPLDEPRRLLDTRAGGVTVDGIDAGSGSIELGGTHQLQVAGRAGVPATAASVVLNVTAVDATAPGFVTVWPCGVTQPLASNLNFATGQTVPNTVIAKVGADGKVCIFSSQKIDAVVDVEGYFPNPAGFTPLDEPRRLFDTRTGFSTVDGIDAGRGGIALGGVHEVQVGGRAGVPSTAASVVLNVTAVDATAAGYVTVWPCGVARPLASNVNFATGQTAPNSVIAKVGADGKVCVFASQAIDAVVDVAGYFPDANGFSPLDEPRRLLDTRAGSSTVDGGDAGAGGIALGAVRELSVAGRAGVPTTAASVVLNVTAVDATSPGFATVWPCGVARPLASNVNFAAGQTIPNSVIAKVGADGKVCIFSSQAIDAVVDVAGYFGA